jgi:hypothetical protein
MYRNVLTRLVIAGAGSGKTKTLAHRVAHLVVNGIDPHRILLACAGCGDRTCHLYRDEPSQEV